MYITHTHTNTACFDWQTSIFISLTISNFQTDFREHFFAAETTSLHRRLKPQEMYFFHTVHITVNYHIRLYDLWFVRMSMKFLYIWRNVFLTIFFFFIKNYNLLIYCKIHVLCFIINNFMNHQCVNR